MTKHTPRIVLVARSAPDVIGDGGTHRTYQIQLDLQRAFGPENVKTVSYNAWRGERVSLQSTEPVSVEKKPLPPVARIKQAVRGQMARSLTSIAYHRENPMRLFAKTHFSTRRLIKKEFLQQYTDAISGPFRPDLCVIEFTGFGAIFDYNRQHGIPTIGCTQNLEALDSSKHAAESMSGLRATLYDLSNELQLLRSCKANLFISKSEASFVGGLGYPDCHFYPYYPVGGVADGLSQVRQRRLQEGQEHGLFLMVGSAIHTTTREGFQWFITQAAQHGLPAGTRVVIAGHQTEQLCESGSLPAGIEVVGWLEQGKLDDYLLRAQAVLVPQRRGFGALTRLPELSMAGIPALTSWHPTLAMNMPPHIYPLDDDWQAWQTAMENVMNGTLSPAKTTYDEWVAQQPNPLETVIRRVLS